MRTNVILTLCVAATAALFSACGAPAANNTAKPANAAAATAPAAPKPATPATPAAPASSTSTSAPAAGGAQDFKLVNKTGVVISSLYVSPSDKDEWGDDILGKDVLGDGENADIKFKRSETAAKWDLKIEDSQGHTIEWTDLNLLEIEKITLHYDGKKATAETE